jgi:hypothetical protein
MTGTTWYGGGGAEPGGRWPSGAGGEGDVLDRGDGGSGPWPPPGHERPPRRRVFGGSGHLARPDRRVAVLLIVVALAFDAAAHGRVDGAATAGLLVVAAGALLASGRTRGGSAVGAALAVVPFATFLAWRESVWLVPVDAMVAVLLLLIAASYASGGRVLRMSLSDAVIRLARGVLSAALAPAYLFGALAALLPVPGDARKQRVVALARGLGIAVPVFVVLGLLLASADPVFASVFRVPVDASSVITHAFLVAVGLLLAAALMVEASSESLPEMAVDARPLGATESGVVLAMLVVLYGAFAGAQIVAARGGAEKVLTTAGLTYADYARQGFFQLLAVAVITLVVLLGLRSLTRPAEGGARWVLVGLGEAATALTLGIVAVAVNRLGLYEQAYGLTMLRLTCTVVAWWLGAVFVLVGLAYAGVGRSQRWIGGAIAVSLLVALLGMNVADPESVVVRRNVDHALATGMFDAPYLVELSDDAVPTLVEELPRLSPGDQAVVRARICQRDAIRRGARARAPEERSPLENNRSAQRAAEARRQVCGA